MLAVWIMLFPECGSNPQVLKNKLWDNGDDDADLTVEGEIESESDTEFLVDYKMMKGVLANSENSTIENSSIEIN